MDISNLVWTDAALNVIDNGTWVGDLPGAAGVEFFVCGMESPEVRKAMEKSQADARIKNGGKPLSDVQRAACVRAVLADFVLKDWRGLTSAGAEVKYDKAQAKAWLTSRNGERLSGIVLVAAQRVDLMAQEFADSAAKN